jgi:serine/threonine-protein kinase
MQRVARDLSGQVVDGRYRVEHELGHGGMGRVWSVQHVESLARLALKVLELDGRTAVSARRRLVREARVAGALRSRHVTRVFDAQAEYVHDGEPLPYIVMERLDGCTLDHWVVTRGPLDPGQTLWVMRQVGRALSEAHGQGIVHRDLKPSNVFLTADEDGAPLVKLCDFGIAKLTLGAATALSGDSATHTAAREVLGTPLYLAPELLRGATLATTATDQWGLALTAFKLLTASEYFGGVRTGPELVLRIAQDPLVPPSAMAALPAGFDAWFLRSCARAPSERFESVELQLAALAAALGDPTPASIHVGEASASPGMSPTSAPLAAADPRRVIVRASQRKPIGLFLAVAWAISGTSWLLVAPPGSANAARADAQHEPAAAHASPSDPAEVSRAPRFVLPGELLAETHVAPAVSSVVLSLRPAQRAVRRPRGQPEHAAPPGRASNQPCERSAQCSSGLCVAERCR